MFADSENFIYYLKLGADSFESGLVTDGSWGGVFPVPFPVLEATYVKFFSIFEISRQS